MRQPDRRRPGADHQHRPGPCRVAGRYPRKRGFRKPVSYAPANRPVRRSRSPQPLLEQVTALGHRFTCAVATTIWRSSIMAGTGADWPRTARRWRCTICRCSGCPWKTPRWPAGYALLELPWQAERLAEALRRTRVTGRLDRRDLSWDGQPRAPAGRRAQSPGRPVPGATPACRSATRTLPGGLRPAGGQRPGWRTGTLDRLGAGLGRCTVADPRSRPAALEAALILRQVPASSHADIAAALDAQCAKATADDVILLFGSFYSVAEGLGAGP